MKKTDCLIIGQGIAGILLAFQLKKMGRQVVVIDFDDPNTASYRAGAILNPVNLNTGKYFPNQNTEFQTATKLYLEIEASLKVSFIDEFTLVDPVPKFTKPIQDFPESLQKITKPVLNQLAPFVSLSTQTRLITKVKHIRFDRLKKAWKNQLNTTGDWISESFETKSLTFSKGIPLYKEIQAERIIFCEGSRGQKNSFFPNLDFTKNKGNTVLLKIQDLPAGYGFHINHKKLLPLGNHQFWWGSNYQWNFETSLPDQDWIDNSLAELKSFLKIPIEVLGTFAAERPTTAGQIPYLLQNPENPNVYLFNGLGTRGFSRGPYLSKLFLNQYFR